MSEITEEQEAQYFRMAQQHADFLCDKIFKPAFEMAFVHGVQHGLRDKSAKAELDLLTKCSVMLRQIAYAPEMPEKEKILQLIEEIEKPPTPEDFMPSVGDFVPVDLRDKRGLVVCEVVRPLSNGQWVVKDNKGDTFTVSLKQMQRVF